MADDCKHWIHASLLSRTFWHSIVSLVCTGDCHTTTGLIGSSTNQPGYQHVESDVHTLNAVQYSTASHTKSRRFSEISRLSREYSKHGDYKREEKDVKETRQTGSIPQ